MNDNIQQPSADQFLLVEDAARSLNIDAKVLRQGIACGLVPMRKDNIGIVRVHLGEVPNDLQNRINNDDVQPALHAAALADEVLSLEQSQLESASQRARLEALIIKQSAAISRYSTLLDRNNNELGAAGLSTPRDAPNNGVAAVNADLAKRDREVKQLSHILDRTFQAIDERDRQVAQQTEQLSGTASKAINLLERAVREGELSAEQLRALNQQITQSTSSSVRLEHELDERNAVINNQNTLMERLVALAEQSVPSTSNRKTRKRSFWQRLFGGGKGI